jgi:hypothetical protein
VLGNRAEAATKAAAHDVDREADHSQAGILASP